MLKSMLKSYFCENRYFAKSLFRGNRLFATYKNWPQPMFFVFFFFSFSLTPRGRGQSYKIWVKSALFLFFAQNRLFAIVISQNRYFAKIAILQKSLFRENRYFAKIAISRSLFRDSRKTWTTPIDPKLCRIGPCP
jgi:hypothetical protein